MKILRCENFLNECENFLNECENECEKNKII